MLCRSTLIMTHSPFSNAVTFEKHNPTLVYYHRWRGGYREIAGPTLPPYSTLHRLSPRNDGDHKTGVLLSQSACRTATMGSPYLVIISRFLPPRCCSAITQKDGGIQRVQFFLFFFLKDERQEEREKERRGRKND